jgi:hypothetical protein
MALSIENKKRSLTNLNRTFSYHTKVLQHFSNPPTTELTESGWLYF